MRDLVYRIRRVNLQQASCPLPWHHSDHFSSAKLATSKGTRLGSVSVCATPWHPDTQTKINYLTDRGEKPLASMVRRPARQVPTALEYSSRRQGHRWHHTIRHYISVQHSANCICCMASRFTPAKHTYDHGTANIGGQLISGFIC